MFAFLLLAAALADRAADFHKFKATFNKQYEPAEEGRRFQIFCDNMQVAELMNRLDRTATYGVTRFMDVTPEEFAATYLTFTPAPVTTRSPELTLGAAPSAYDWDEQGKVYPAKDQGNCGSCWSFSCTGALESAHAIAGGSLYSLSEQQLVDCNSPPNSGCEGGNMVYTHPYQKSTGQTDQAAYPYVGKDQDCKLTSSMKIYAKVKEWGSVPANEAQLVEYLYSKGPLPVGMNANPLQFYTGGIHDPASCSPALANHAVLAVGYNKGASSPYWRIKNSWGPNWGESGFFRMSYGKNTCGIADSATWTTA